MPSFSFIRSSLSTVVYCIALAVNSLLLTIAIVRRESHWGYVVLLTLLLLYGVLQRFEWRRKQWIQTKESLTKQQVERRRQRLESLGTLASGIAHDLNNLLTPILMSGKMLQRETPNVDRVALADTIVAGATRGADLIAQLLTFARGGDGNQSPVQLAKLLPETGRILERTLPKGISLHVCVDSDLPEVIGDETEMSQLVMNLAINGRDAMNGDGELTIAAERVSFDSEHSCSYTVLPPGDYVRISVTDNGHGIDESIRDRIFEPFFSTKQRGNGTGLGLSTTIGIIQSHRGAIEVETKVGEGTTFHVLLPSVSH
ncbi:two-component sensor histidine kinase [Rhodopirellula sp. JC740]|uniref:histidine kinase n=1 Tax=Rhodopirellula halodulae TaxID=2894198 RepID=A0ABS8NFE1_9BACT|nr:ATP-binding protein [Rhodopirellula sp. JC740]MCC9642276.1 two-component sensor histidine kinase [Rhodopirellula sp. JC740]